MVVSLILEDIIDREKLSCIVQTIKIYNLSTITAYIHPQVAIYSDVSSAAALRDVFDLSRNARGILDMYPRLSPRKSLSMTEAHRRRAV